MSIPEIPPKQRVHNKPCSYSASERAILQPFRKKYENESNKQARLQLLRGEILPALFNYWVEHGERPQTAEESSSSIQRLVRFIQNNWRRPHKLQINSHGKVIVRKHDVVRELLPERVQTELQGILQVEAEVTTSHPGYFKNINTAISRVSNSLSVVEEEIIEAAMASRERSGNDPHKQRKLFEKSGRRKVARAANQHWLEMGILQFSLTAARQADGQWCIDVHDNMAKTMGITAKPFSHSIEGKIMELQRDFMVYVCNLSDTAQPGTQATQTTFKPRHDLQVTIDASGYPVMPMEPTEDVVQTKSELAGLLRTYLNKHYYLASARQRKSAPFTLIAAQCNKFVDKQYQVPGLGIRDPNSFQKAELLSIISHIRSRQDAHGFEDAFRWKNVSDAGGELELARYGYNAKHAKTKKASARQKARRKTQKPKQAAERLAQLDGLIPMPGELSDNASMPGDNHQNVANHVDAMAPPPPDDIAAGGSLNAAIDPNIDPKLQDQGTREHSTSPQPIPFPLKHITELQYQRIRTTMPLNLLPINGPNEGPPQYAILPTLWDEYVTNLENGVFDQAPPPARQKRMRGPEILMMEEAEKLIGSNPTKRSRAAAAVARMEAEKANTKRPKTRRKK